MWPFLRFRGLRSRLSVSIVLSIVLERRRSKNKFAIGFARLVAIPVDLDMCVRHAYYCSKCYSFFEMPLEEWWRQYLSCQCFGMATDHREICTDQLCDNAFCQRRTEGGNRVCLRMMDPCYFCIRFGNDEQCYTKVVAVECQKCCSGDQDCPLPCYRRVAPAETNQPIDTACL